MEIRIMLCFGAPSQLRQLSSVSSAITINRNIIKPSSVILDLGVLFDAELSMRQHVACVTDVLLSSAPHTLSPSSTRPRRHCQAGYSFGAVAPWPLQRCSCGFAGDDTSPSTESLACSSTYCSRLKARRPLSLLLCGSCIGCRPQREYSTSCACLCTRCSSGTLPITLPACWRPPLTFLHGRRCVRPVTVTWSYTKNESEDWWQALSVAAPRACNRLPTDLKLLHSTASFKSKLKSFLFHAAYTGNTVWTLECAVGLTVGGALQVIVVAVTNLKVKVAMSSDGFYRQLVAYW